VHVVDTTAAGDTCTGYFFAGLAENRRLADALDLACKAAALAVSRPGAARSIPRRREVERFPLPIVRMQANDIKANRGSET
jgi:ribokinase